ncbi:hypothetical protein I3842_11G007600 [Carya illinoinensis]|uniref:Purple acid phosphatase n=1 Tax=Carya illinoinensis TaxID=32201 RepID=A0A922DKR4_CARIL|nr:hypothetical protein I3842_11G007600 [Carya illinoinensis]
MADTAWNCGLMMMKLFTMGMLWWLGSMGLASGHGHGRFDEHPLSEIDIYKTTLALRDSVSIKANPLILGLKGQDKEWVTVNVVNPDPSEDDWVAVFSPAEFNASTCSPVTGEEEEPYICSSPIKFKYANYSNSKYTKTGKTVLKFQLINQRADFSFVLFSGGLSTPKLVAVSNFLTFANPKAPLYPRLAQGKSWDEMTVTWTSGYALDEAVPFVEYAVKGQAKARSPAGTLTIDQNSLCGSPARTVGWRDQGFIHTSFLKNLWPNFVYAERDGSTMYADYQPGSLNTTDQLIKDLKNIDIVFVIGDLAYANGYISQWDQFMSQVEPIASTVPFMVASGNHERTWPNSGGFYQYTDSGGECGVTAETLFYFPAENRANFWYSTDYGMFRFCIADSEHDWREGSEQYRFLEHCLATVDRRKQPWLIFAAHRPLGYSSNEWYAEEGAYSEPMEGMICRSFGKSIG